jgi:methylmalonyl-CoA mutase N-terminal domain/subunit
MGSESRPSPPEQNRAHPDAANGAAKRSETRNERPPANKVIAPAHTSSGIELEPIYTPASVAGIDAERDIGSPGRYPFTRGVQSTMYRSRLWTMRQYSGLASAEESNARYKFLLEQGQTGISVALDLPTQLGMDSDDPNAFDEVGRVGVAIDTLADMELLFDGIPLDRVSTSFTINSTAAILLAMYFAVAERQGVPTEKLLGTIQNDILKEYAARGTWIFPPAPALRLIVDTIEYCVKYAPRFNPISVAGAHFRDAGATAVQELAFTLADGISYVQACINRGLRVDDFAGQISFYFYTHNDLFEEVAKYRAGRRLWAWIMKERFGAKDPRSQMFRFGVVCGGSTLTAQQPFNNIVRVAYQALASVLGGVQSMFTAAWDEAYAIPTEQSAELALRTQQILAYETGVANVVDPLGGSYYIEALTDQVEVAARAIIERVEQMGGMSACIQNGTIQREIAGEAYKHQRRIDSGEQTVVGVNRFVRAEPERQLALYELDPASALRQRQRLAKTRRERDELKVEQSLAALREAARGAANMMEPISQAVRAYATIGEICSVLRGEFGTFQEPVGL